MSLEYRMTDGKYALFDDNEPVLQGLEEVALCFDAQTGTLHKHGAPARVMLWHLESQKAFRAAGFDNMAEQLIAVSGRFPTEEINRCLSNTGYSARFYDKLKAGEIQSVELPEAPDLVSSASVSRHRP